MTISYAKSIPEEDKPLMRALIVSISPDMIRIVEDPNSTIIVMGGWHASSYVDPYSHFNVMFPPGHYMSGRQIHVHAIPQYDSYGRMYYIPVPT